LGAPECKEADFPDRHQRLREAVPQTLGHWPLMSADEARSKAMEVLRQCRNGETPSRRVALHLPTLREAYASYCLAKKIKAYVSPRSFRGLRFQECRSCVSVRSAPGAKA
jgi:hypothetical protein